MFCFSSFMGRKPHCFGKPLICFLFPIGTYFHRVFKELSKEDTQYMLYMSSLGKMLVFIEAILLQGGKLQLIRVNQLTVKLTRLKV